MALQRQRNAAALNMNLHMIKEGIHWNKDLTPAVKEKMMFRDPRPEEKNTEESKKQISQLPLTASTQRDIRIDYMNPREELPKFTKGVDQIPPFDQGTVDLMRPYDFELRQQVNEVIRARSSYVLEEGKYDITMETEQERAQAIRNKQADPAKKETEEPDPGVTPSMAAELNFHSLMETTSTL